MTYSITFIRESLTPQRPISNWRENMTAGVYKVKLLRQPNSSTLGLTIFYSCDWACLCCMDTSYLLQWLLATNCRMKKDVKSMAFGEVVLLYSLLWMAIGKSTKMLMLQQTGDWSMKYRLKQVAWSEICLLLESCNALVGSEIHCL